VYQREQTNVSLGRTHGGGGNSKDILDNLTSEAELSDDLLISEGCKKSVGPGVNADFVAGHVLFDQNSWSLKHARADDKESSLESLLVKIFEQFSTKFVKLNVWDPARRQYAIIPSVRSRTIVETDTPGILGWAYGDVGGSGVSTTRPPSVVSSLGKIIRTAGASTIGSSNVRDVDTFEFLHPTRHLVGVEC